MSSYSSSSSSSSTTDSDVEEELKRLTLRDDKEINILLLGETGVGKSTFINAMANYLSLKYFENAAEKGLVKLIPTEYTMHDKNGKKHEIKVGPKKDENECLKTGESATQNVKTYVFPISSGHVKVRLIDTPGMGDTRGIEQDEINCGNIIKYIKKINKIHAVCFLCKPTLARKTVYFDYCVYQILSHLEEQAAKNIFFLFTNTRGSDYNPGESLSIVKTIIKSVESSSGVKIPLDKDKNIYCFENEGFRFLGACEKKIQFDDSIKEKCMESWKRSAVQCWRFIRYLQRDIEPYVPSKLEEVNFARNMLFQFSRVLAEIKQQIADNQLVLDRLEDNKKKEYDSISELKNRKTAVTDVIMKKLSQPMLVCTSVPSCAQVYKVRGIEKRHYKRICHSCYELSSSTRLNVAGCPEIVNCHAIDGSTRKCTQCGCDFLLHMHVDYITSLEENVMVDEDVGHRLATRESLLDNYSEITDDVKVQNTKFQNEYDTLKEFCMNLSRYMKDHAIVAFSDSYKEYILYLINQNKASGASNMKTSVDNLQKLRLEYIEAEQAFLQVIKSPLISSRYLNFEMKDEQFQILFELQEKGKKLKDLYNLEKIVGSKEYAIDEYVHSTYYVGKKGGSKGYEAERKHRGRRRGGQSGPHQDGGSSNRPERPDSRNSTSSYQSNRRDGRNRSNFQHERPDSRNSTSSYQSNRRDGRNRSNFQHERPDSRSSGAGYTQPPNHYMHPYNSAPGHYGSQHFKPTHNDRDPPRGSSHRGRNDYHVNVTVDSRDSPRHSSDYSHPHGPNYSPSHGQHHPPPHGQHPPPPHGQHPPPYYGQHPPPYYGQHPPPYYGQHPPSQPGPDDRSAGSQWNHRGASHQNSNRGRYNNRAGDNKHGDNLRNRNSSRGRMGNKDSKRHNKNKRSGSGRDSDSS